ncbi:MAG: glycosyltransferase [Methyloprofundus sp.]|nr:glycosyltransferase [Methyloprofundus sp.]
MTDFPLISVVMPCFNGAEFLGRSIDSVFEQTYPHLELIVVNDGSTDGSLALLNAIQDSRLILINQQNTGVCKARNRAIRQAKGEFIAFLDADDTWEPDCLFKLYQAFIKQPETVLAYCGWQNIGLSGGRGAPFIPPDYQRQSNKLECLFENCCWPIHATLTRRLAIEQVGGFDESLLTSEDFLLWLKIASQQLICLVPEVLAYYHFHEGLQATQNTAKTAINHWLAQKKFLQQDPTLKATLDEKLLAKLMHGELLRRGYDCYWKRDLKAARTIFKAVMKIGYGSLQDWKYMLPSVLPYFIHSALLNKIDS